MHLLPSSQLRAPTSPILLSRIVQTTKTAPLEQPGFALIAIASWACLVALLPGWTKLVALAALPLPVLIRWLFSGWDRWIIAFILAATLLPPLPFAMGDSGPHVAPLFALVGLLLTLARRFRLTFPQTRVLMLICIFVGCLLVSEVFAVFRTDPQVVLFGVFRIGLFCIGPLVLLNALSTADPEAPKRTARILFRIAVAAAVFACADFYFQFPSPAGFGAQFVWLDNEVLRRAQGLFYEASTLGNFCAFFLLFAFVFFSGPGELRPCSRTELALGSCVLAAALVFSYSRASLLNLFCSVTMFLILSGKRWKPIVGTATGAAVLGVIIVSLLFPIYWQHYWLRLQQSILYSGTATNAVLSGRLTTWQTLAQFASEHPANLVFGVGYKTLPYSDSVGTSVIPDNTYLGLLIETGVLGLGAFLAMNFEFLRQAFKVARGPVSMQSLAGVLFLCFWTGELVQMFSGDLITYWRVLPCYFWTLGVALTTGVADSGRTFRAAHRECKQVVKEKRG